MQLAPSSDHLLRRSIFLILLSFSIGARLFAKKDDEPRCLAKLRHPAAEIYLRSAEVSRSLPTTFAGAQLPNRIDARLRVLESSPRWPYFERILAKAQAADLHDFLLNIFVELESYYSKLGVLHNFHPWLAFLDRSRERELYYRAYEGLHAVHLLRDGQVKVAFEPKKGFFLHPETRASMKSMDLELRDPKSMEVVAYQEVKRVFMHRNVPSALDSALGKASFTRTQVGREVALSVAIYVDSPPLASKGARFQQYSDFVERIAYIKSTLQRSFQRQELELDSVLLVDIQLSRFVKIYVRQNGTLEDSSGDYPLN